jgi:hypothetical protein
MISEAF